MEGWLTKKGRVTWKRRYFTLQDSTLTYYARKGDPKCRGQMTIVAQTIYSDSTSKRNGFSLVTDGKGYQLYAETPEEKKQWKEALLGAIGTAVAASAAAGQRLAGQKGGAAAPAPSHQQETRTFYVVGTEFVLDTRYELIKPIGHGAYGVVISAMDHVAGHKVAIKKCPNAFEDLVDAKRIVREIRLLMHFRHENIVKVLDIQAPATSDFNDVYIVSELMDTDLHRVIYSRQKLTEDHVQFFLYQMLCALKYMHSAKVLHRDLKPSNILLNSNCDLKLCDFGLSRGLNTGQEAVDLTEYVVTRWYRAPEIMLSCQDYTTAIDMWSVGCVFGEMLGRKPLFPGNDYIHQLKLITKLLGTPTEEELSFVTNQKARRFMLNLPKEPPSSLKLKYPEASDDAIDLLEKMLVIDPARRIQVTEALEHPYLASLHDPTVEIEAEQDVHWGDIETCELSKVNLQRQILEDILKFHPEVQDFYDRLYVSSSSLREAVEGRYLAFTMSYDARPSLGARSIAGGNATSRPAYSFPILSTKEIVTCLNELQIRLMEVEINEPDKHRDSIRRVYEQLVEFCTGIAREELSQPVFSGISVLNFPELHEESIPELAFMRACSKMMQVCGVFDFTMKDVLTPDTKRVRRHLSAIINFAKFKEERFAMFTDLADKRDSLLLTLKRLQDEEVELTRERDQLNEQMSSELSVITQLQKDCEVAEADIESLNTQQAAVRHESNELKQQSNELKERIAAKTSALDQAKAERQRVRGQIVRSPERVRHELAAAARDVEAERTEGLAAERDAREMNLRVSSVQKAEKDVSKAITNLEDIQNEIEKQRVAMREVRDSQKALSANRQKLGETAIEMENVKRQLSRFEERLTHLRRQAKTKAESLENVHTEAQAELLEIEKLKRAHQAAVDETEGEIMRLQCIINKEKSQFQSVKGEMLDAFKGLKEAIAQHQKPLLDALRVQEEERNVLATPN